MSPWTSAIFVSSETFLPFLASDVWPRLQETPLLIGSEATAENVGPSLGVADGVIVGSSLKADGRCENAVDVERVRRFVEAACRVAETARELCGTARTARGSPREGRLRAKSPRSSPVVPGMRRRGSGRCDRLPASTARRR